jgi:hypothetical protein
MKDKGCLWEYCIHISEEIEEKLFWMVHKKKTIIKR